MNEAQQILTTQRGGWDRRQEYKVQQIESEIHIKYSF